MAHGRRASDLPTVVKGRLAMNKRFSVPLLSTGMAGWHGVIGSSGSDLAFEPGTQMLKPPHTPDELYT